MAFSYCLNFNTKIALTQVIKNWLLLVFHDGIYAKFFGFNRETFDNDAWPAMFCLKPIKVKMHQRAPRLMKEKNANGDLVETHLCYVLYRKFETEREKRRKLKGFPQKLAEKKKGIFFPNSYNPLFIFSILTDGCNIQVYWMDFIFIVALSSHKFLVFLKIVFVLDTISIYHFIS